MVRACEAVDAIKGGGDGAALAWFGAPHMALGAAPLLLIQTVSGLVEVMSHLESRLALL